MSKSLQSHILSVESLNTKMSIGVKQLTKRGKEETDKKTYRPSDHMTNMLKDGQTEQNKKSLHIREAAKKSFF